MSEIIKILIAFFAMGGILMFWINKNKDKKTKQNSLVKYLSYFTIVISVLSIINFLPIYTYILFIIIIIIGLYELIKTRINTKNSKSHFSILYIIGYTIVGVCFILFSFSAKELVLFSYLVVVVFDAFSQLSGQLFGNTKLFPKVSPNKTVEGLIGGVVFSMVLVFIIKNKFSYTFNNIYLSTIIIILSSVLGDYLASLYKRHHGIKDFSKLIPQHGGVLDRFDSYIVSGAIIYIISIINIYL